MPTSSIEIPSPQLNIVEQIFEEWAGDEDLESQGLTLNHWDIWWTTTGLKIGVSIKFRDPKIWV